MKTWTDEMVISKPARDVFEFAINLDNCSTWIPKITNIDKHFDGDMEVGSSWDETRKEGKREMTMKIEVFELDRKGPVYIHTAGANIKSMKSYYRFAFEPIDELTCKVSLTAVLEAKVWWVKLLGGLMVSMMKKMEGDLLSRLKTACEK